MGIQQSTELPAVPATSPTLPSKANTSSPNTGNNNNTNHPISPNVNLPQNFEITLLDLSRKKISNLDQFALHKYTRLRELDLSFNRLKASGNWQSLEYFATTLISINLSSNPLGQLPDQMYLCSKLENLTGENCQLTTLSPEFTKFRELVSINLAKNKLTQLPKLQEKNFGYVENVNLSFNALEDYPPTWCFVNITKLVLNKNELVILPTEIKRMKRLTLLNLADNFLQIIPKEIGELKNLKKLYLDHNELIEIPRELGEIEGLRELNIRANQLTWLPQNMAKLQNLQILDLEENELHPEKYQTEDIPALLEFLKTVPEPKESLRPKSTGKKTRVRGEVAAPSTPSSGSFMRTPSISEARCEKCQQAITNTDSKFCINCGDALQTQNSFLVLDRGKQDDTFTFIKVQKILYIVKGDKRLFIRALDPLLANLNHEDSYVLDSGKKFFIWLGRDATQRSKNKAIYFAHRLNEEQGTGEPTSIVKLDSAQVASSPVMEEFFRNFIDLPKPAVSSTKGANSSNNAAKTGMTLITRKSLYSNSDFEITASLSTKLFRFSEGHTGRLEVNVWAGGHMPDSLDSSATYLLDCGSLLFVWSGTYSSNSERAWALLKADELREVGNRPKCTRVEWVLDGQESWLFRDQWLERLDNAWDVGSSEISGALLKVRSRASQKIEQKLQTTLRKRANNVQASPRDSATPSSDNHKLLASLRIQGYLDQRTKDKKWKKRYWVLEDGAMLRYASENDAILKKKHLERFALSECHFEEGPEDFSFQITVDKRPLLLRAKDDIEMTKWMNMALKQKILKEEPVLAKEGQFVTKHDEEEWERREKELNVLRMTLEEEELERERIEDARLEKERLRDQEEEQKRREEDARKKEIELEQERKRLLKLEEERLKKEEQLRKEELELEREIQRLRQEREQRRRERKEKLSTLATISQELRESETSNVPETLKPVEAKTVESPKPKPAVETPKPVEAKAIESPQPKPAVETPKSVEAKTVESPKPKPAVETPKSVEAKTVESPKPKPAVETPKPVETKTIESLQSKPVVETPKPVETKTIESIEKSSQSTPIVTTPPVSPRESSPQCTRCKAELKPNQKFCIQCGTSAPVAATSAPKKTPSPRPDDETRPCSKCQAPVKTKSKFCTKCGATVESAALALEKCATCFKTVYAAERLPVDNLLFHKNCFKCVYCKKPLSLTNCARVKGKYVCELDFRTVYASGNLNQAKTDLSEFEDDEDLLRKESELEEKRKRLEQEEEERKRTLEQLDKFDREKQQLEKDRLDRKRETDQYMKKWTEKNDTTDDLLADIGSVAARMTGFARPMPARNRKEPSKNVFADRRQREEEATKQKDSTDNTNNNSKSEGPASARALVGGFGLLYAVSGEAQKMLSKPTQNAAKEVFDGPRLIQVKGRRSIFSRQVELAAESLNSGDCFLLDTGKTGGLIYQWNGAKSNRIVKGKAMDVAKNIKDKDRQGVSRVIILDEGTLNDETRVNHDRFWKLFPAKQNPRPAESESQITTAEKAYWSHVKLFKIIYEPHKTLELEEIAVGRMSKSLLDDAFCYILDSITELFVWTGKKSPINLKTAAVKLANELRSLREFWVAPVKREFPGTETVLFREKFADWGSLPIQGQQPKQAQKEYTAIQQSQIDIKAMHVPAKPREEVMVDDGKGKVTQWVVNDFKKADLDPSRYGQFFTGESYVVLYTYVWKNKDCHLIYFWQGRNSRVQEKGSSALLTVDLDKQLEGMAKEVRVTQGREPKHFLAIFQGRFVVHLGDEKRDFTQGWSFYAIHGIHEWSVRAFEVPLKAWSLNSMQVMVLRNAKQVFVWNGVNTTQYERAMAKNFITQTFGGESENVKFFEEGSEPQQFWEALGAKTPSEQQYAVCKLPRRITPRLFCISGASGVIKAEEILNFSQDDLEPDDVFILDAYHQVFVWFGMHCSPSEQKVGMETALEYVKTATDLRTMQTTDVLRIKQGEEPSNFATHFHGWDYTAAAKAKIKGSQRFGVTEDSLQLKGGTPVEALLAEYTRTYSYQELVDRAFPKGTDASKLETLLAEEEFLKVFEMDKSAFYALPLWKQQAKKKELSLI